MGKFIIIKGIYYLMVIFLWVEKKVKEKCTMTEYYIKKVLGIMIYFKVMLSSIFQMVKFSLMEISRMENHMVNVKNILKVVNLSLKVSL